MFHESAHFDDVRRPIPALNSLHDTKNLHTPSVVPSLDALGCDKDSALELMKEFFQCNIDKFDERNELYILKEILLASRLSRKQAAPPVARS